MHQPLIKRFTQCGSLTMLFGVFIILFGVSSTALTTFGKGNTNQATQGPVVKGRECINHDDCASIQHTSCVKDPNDYRLRCLCGDDVAPVNGLCSTTVKGLRHKCVTSNECEEHMVCITEAEKNGTRSVGVAKFMSSKTKLCLCDSENGYEENIADSICSGGVLQAITSALLPALLLSCIAVATSNFRWNEM